MSEVAERFRKLAAGFTARVDAVPEDKWSAQSPCDGWTARDVVEHMIGNCKTFVGFAGIEIPDKPLDNLPLAQIPGDQISGDQISGDQISGEWKQAADSVQAALDDEAVATKEFQGYAGPTNLAQATERFLFTDLVVHAWDLARATGGDERLPIDEVGAAHEAMRQMGEMLRSAGAARPEIEPEPGADAQTKLLNFMGRRV